MERRTDGTGCRSFNVVLPQAPGFNVGMAAVDLGLVAAFHKLGFEAVPWRIGALKDRALKQAPDLDSQAEMGVGRAETIRDDWPKGLADPILYWGDFHHQAQYVDAVGRIIGARTGGHSAARRYLLLDGVSTEIKERSASFGTTLIFNGIRDFLGGDYTNALKEFLGNNSTTFFRDPISTTLVRRWRDSGVIGTGVDPALILESDQIPQTYLSSGSVGVFFGRSEETHPGLWEIAIRLAKENTARLEWLDWGDLRGFPQMSIPEQVHRMKPLGSTTAMDVLSHLASCSAVVTDSYHAALISWRLGIPAVTVTAPVSPVDMPVNSGGRWSWRDKRELAASQYGALDLVVRPEELDDVDRLNGRIDHILDLFRGEAAMSFIRTQIETEVETSLAAFATQLEGSRAREDKHPRPA
ncbi:MAG: polysaccharide pyruvyl transferase family protein [Actinomycetota bacterium]|nr:polysaccharide pyruvyl transferase family protein [Actinomycetota bacterium]